MRNQRLVSMLLIDNVDAAAMDTLADRTRAAQELRLADSIRNATNQICTTVSDIDDKFGISNRTMQAITAAQEIDERNHVSEKVVESVRRIDQQLHISEALVVGYERTRQLDERYHVSNNISAAGAQVLGCMQHLETEYELTTRLSSAASTAASFIHERLWGPADATAAVNITEGTSMAAGAAPASYMILPSDEDEEVIRCKGQHQSANIIPAAAVIVTARPAAVDENPECVLPAERVIAALPVKVP